MKLFFCQASQAGLFTFGIWFILHLGVNFVEAGQYIRGLQICEKAGAHYFDNRFCVKDGLLVTYDELKE